MAVTRTTDLPNFVVAKYLRDYFVQAYGEEVWGQYVDWMSMAEGNSGSSFDFLGMAEMDPIATVLDEESDIVPVRLADDHLVVTPSMYGNAVVTSEEARFRARADIRAGGAKAVAQNRTRSVDRLIRNGVLGGLNVLRANDVALRTDLDAATAAENVSYNFLQDLHTYAMACDIEPIGPDNTFIAPINELVAAEIKKLTEYKEIQYRRPVNLQGKEIMGGVMPFVFAGFHFIPHKWGKVYMSGGTVAQSATTLSADAAAGATSVVVASASGIAAGDFITLGTLEALKSETVKVTVVAGTTLTVAGAGNKASNLGLKYAHLSGEAVTEAAFVGAIPVIGRNSLHGVYAANTGRYGVPVLTEGIDILQRFIYQGWKAHFGVGLWERYIIRGEFSLTRKQIMADV